MVTLLGLLQGFKSESHSLTITLSRSEGLMEAAVHG